MSKRNLRIKLAVILCLFSAITMVTASATENQWDDDWEYVGESTLYQGDTYSARGYVVEVIDFDKNNGLVLLELKKGDILLNRSVLNVSCDNFTYEEEVGIKTYTTSDDILSENPTGWKNPRIHLEFYVWKIPGLSLDVSISRVTYRPPDSDIYVTVEIENTGEVEIENVDIDIDPAGLEVKYGKLTHHFASIEDDESETIDLIFRVPKLLFNRSFTISANTSGIDEKDTVYTASDSETLNVLPLCDLKINKVTTNTSMDRDVRVGIEVMNTGIVDLDITLVDTIPSNFELHQQVVPINFEIGHKNLTWRVVLKPHEEKVYHYYMEPLRPGVFTINPVDAEWNIRGINYSVNSNTPVMAVDGAYIIFNRTAFPAQVKCGEHVTVNISVVNTGNKAASVSISDVLPNGTSLISGNTTLQTNLNANQAAAMEYVIRMDASGNITFPHSVVELISKDYSRLQVSDIINIDVFPDQPIVTLTPDPQPTVPDQNDQPRQKVPKFEIAFTVFLLIFAYLAMKYG
ncbi:MAG: hypothetical protein ACT6FG_04850 [Methanosarcinaceae archaeon]